MNFSWCVDVFIGLNAIRALSIIACLLVFASSITTMVHDVEAVNRFIAEGKDDSSNSTSNLMSYEYIAYVSPTFYCRVPLSCLYLGEKCSLKCGAFDLQ